MPPSGYPGGLTGLFGQAIGVFPVGQVSPYGVNSTAFNNNSVNQMGLANLLQQQANGQGPNLGYSQLQNATNQNVQQASALGQSMPGQQYQSAYRNILNAQSAARQQSVAQGQTLQDQQRLAAQQQLAGVLNQYQQGQVGMQSLQGQNALNFAGLNQTAGLAQQGNAMSFLQSLMRMGMGGGAGGGAGMGP